MNNLLWELDGLGILTHHCSPWPLNERCTWFPLQSSQEGYRIWHLLYGYREITGHIPLMVHGGDVARFHHWYEIPIDSTEDLIQKGIENSFEAHLQSWSRRFDEFDDQSPEEWPSDYDGKHEPSFSDQSPAESLYLLLVPCPKPWMVPAFLGPAGGNIRKPPEFHISFWKRWYEQYGARVTFVSGSWVEMYAERPPTTQDAAIRLALEHGYYCVDFIAQCHGTVKRGAAALLNASYWLFGWD